MPISSAICRRAAVPTSFSREPWWPMTIPFWESRSTIMAAKMSISGLSAGRSARSPISSIVTIRECGSSSWTPSSAASRISSAIRVSVGSSVTSPSG